MERLVYISKARVSGLDEVRDILATAKRCNARDGLTGMLWWQGRFFVQVLEGSTAALDQLIAKLKQDRRHTDIRILGRKLVETPQFGNWNMGLITSVEDEKQFLMECLGHDDLGKDSLSAEDLAHILDRLVAMFPPNMDRILSA